MNIYIHTAYTGTNILFGNKWNEVLSNVIRWMIPQNSMIDKGKHNKGIGFWAHDKSESTQGRGEDR
jgi:hypothetical protein